eukprot:jgi/Mesen1/7480/ME000039S06698
MSTGALLLAASMDSSDSEPLLRGNAARIAYGVLLGVAFIVITCCCCWPKIAALFRRARTAPADLERGATTNEPRPLTPPLSTTSSSVPSSGGSFPSLRSSSSSSLHEDARSRGLAAASKAPPEAAFPGVVVLMPGQELPMYLGRPLGTSSSSQQGDDDRAHDCASDEAHAPVATESAALPPEGTAVAPPPQGTSGGSVQLASLSPHDIGV